MTSPYAGPPVTFTCPICGYTRTYRTPGIAAGRFPKHSCERQARLQARAQRVQDRINDDGVRRDCTCKNAHHQHGTDRAYRIDRCRCKRCRKAHREAAYARSRALAYGRWNSGRTEVGPVREHLQMLISHNISDRTIARHTGVSRSTIRVILHGRTERGRQKNKTTTEEVAERILALKPSLKLLPARTYTDATCTRRRLQALVAIGWPQNRLAERLNLTLNNFISMLKQESVTAARAQAVHEIYELLWNTPPAPGKDAGEPAITRARALASRKGWLPPMAWDEDSIDDPTTEPSLQEDVKAINQDHKIDVLAEDVAYMHRTGSSINEIEQRTARAWKDIRRLLNRAGHQEILYRIDLQETLPRERTRRTA